MVTFDKIQPASRVSRKGRVLSLLYTKYVFGILINLGRFATRYDTADAWKVVD